MARPTFPPATPPLVFTEEYRAINYILSLSSSDSQWKEKAFTALSFVLLYSHGLVPQATPLELDEFTYDKFVNKQLVGMEGVVF